MMSSKLTILGIALLALCLAAAAVGCTQEDAPTPTAQATDTPVPTPTLEPTDMPTSTPTTQPTDTPEAVPTPEATDSPDPTTTPDAIDTPEDTPTSGSIDAESVCMALDPTSTPDPNRPEGIRGRLNEFWNVSSFEEAECITDYPIAVPTNLPDGFIRAQNMIVYKHGTSHFEDRWVEHSWYIPGDPPYGFMLSQHSWKFSLGNGEPAIINGIPGERLVDHQGLTLLWEENGYWFTIFGVLHGPITEEFLLEVAASLELRENGSG